MPYLRLLNKRLKVTGFRFFCINSFPILTRLFGSQKGQISFKKGYLGVGVWNQSWFMTNKWTNLAKCLRQPMTQNQQTLQTSHIVASLSKEHVHVQTHTNFIKTVLEIKWKKTTYWKVFKDFLEFFVTMPFSNMCWIWTFRIFYLRCPGCSWTLKQMDSQVL